MFSLFSFGSLFSYFWVPSGKNLLTIQRSSYFYLGCLHVLALISKLSRIFWKCFPSWPLIKIKQQVKEEKKKRTEKDMATRRLCSIPSMFGRVLLHFHTHFVIFTLHRWCDLSWMEVWRFFFLSGYSTQYHVSWCEVSHKMSVKNRFIRV